jgi:hypothetical protein
VLGAAPGHPLSNVEQKGEASHTKSDATSYWPLHRWGGGNRLFLIARSSAFLRTALGF